MVSKDKSEGMVRIVPELRTLVKFQRLNFMDGNFGIQASMDVIFCRNVLIYFDKNTGRTPESPLPASGSGRLPCHRPR